MKDWDYSILTHNANVNGGPEKYIISETSQKAIKETNKKWLKGSIPLVLMLAPFVVKGVNSVVQENVPKIRQHFNKNISIEKTKDTSEKTN